MATLDNLRKSAKRWLKELREGNTTARERLVRASPDTRDPITLRDVQHALARERGFASWIALKQAVTAATSHDSALSDLLTAADKGDVARVTAVLQAHPEVIDRRGTLPGHTGLRSALHFGVGHEDVVRALLDRGADPNIRDEGDNAFPIHFAAERGNLAIVKLLVEHGADPVGSGTTHELDALGWAVCFDYAMQLDVAHYLLAHGAKHTLLSAVAMGATDAIHALAAGGADLDQRMDRTNHRRTPLHLAIVKKQPGSLVALIDLGASLDLTDAVGLTPLDQAALDDQREMTQLLLDAGARITLPAAIVLERSDDVERLVRADPESLSTTNNRGWARLLVHASGRSSARVVETLIRTIMRHRAGLSIVNMQDDEDTAVDGAAGYTPLHAAAFQGNDEVVAVLLKHGANPRTRDGKYCATPAGWAAYAGHTSAATLILEHDVDIFDAISFDRADRIAELLDRDPAAIERPFKAYASCPSREGQWWPTPDCTPLDWATTQHKPNAVRVLTERGAGTRTTEDVARAGRVVAFLQSACWDHREHGKGDHRMYDRAAQRLLAQDPTLARDSIYSAIVCGERDEVARILAERPEAARLRGGGRGWTPILYLAYTRFSHPATISNALAIARMLLDHAADPNDFYMAGDSKYTVLVGVAAEGEQDAPRQPYAKELFALMLERGAEPFDIQVLYNTHFSGDMLWWLDLVYKHTIDTARAAAWSDPEWPMFDMGAYGSGARFLIETAIKTKQLDLMRWVLAHGANPNAAPARDNRFPKCSLYDLALDLDAPDMAELLLQHGATSSGTDLTDEERFLRACFRLDRQAAKDYLDDHPDYVRSPLPLFAAARGNRTDVLALLVELGFDLEAQDPTGKRVLHEAAANNALAAARFLVERGVEIDPRESSYNATPIGWAAHGDRTEMVEFLSRRSREIWTLCFGGYVDRVREVLAEDPGRARLVTPGGHTPLWWLPDDEEKAMATVELLLAAGADPSLKAKDGRTAADWARRRGMLAVAARLDAAASSP